MGDGFFSCRLKRVATCSRCLKEFARVFRPIHPFGVTPLEEELFPGGVEAEAP